MGMCKAATTGAELTPAALDVELLPGGANGSRVPRGRPVSPGRRLHTFGRDATRPALNDGPRPAGRAVAARAGAGRSGPDLQAHLGREDARSYEGLPA